jgi:uncharacterized protein (TIGR01319 family)
MIMSSGAPIDVDHDPRFMIGSILGGLGVVLCADVGSTYTKVAAVDLDGGVLLGTATRPTTVDTDVLRGLDAAIADLGRPGMPVRVCSSAGGGLRLAVVGYEELVTAEAGRRVGLSAGAHVVHTAAGCLDGPAVATLRARRPDVVLLVGGTDGGDVEVLRHNAGRLAAARLRIPVVVAGNADGRDEVSALLAGRGVPVVVTGNVLPRIGELNPGPARAAIREVFLRHVIGGKKLSRGPRFASLVRGPTPDLVLTATELLAAELGGDLLVVDVGGATTDVYSVLGPDPTDAGDLTDAERTVRDLAGAALSQDVAGTLWHSRTVEGDLGMRQSAPGVLAAAVAERLLKPGEADVLAPAVRAREDPSYLPVTGTDQSDELRIAQLAAVIAVRRHARGEDKVTGNDRVRRDLRRVRLVVGSGGVLRHAGEGAEQVLAAVLTDHAGGWALPRAATPVLDLDYVLAPAGLLAPDHPAAAQALLRTALLATRPP